MLGQLFDIEADDGPSIGGAQMADEQAQLVEVGDHAASASLLQAEQNLSLHLRRQSVQRDLMTGEDRRSGPTPRLEIDIKSFAALIPPPCIVRSTQPPAIFRLTVTHWDRTGAQSRQRSSGRMVHELDR